MSSELIKRIFSTLILIPFVFFFITKGSIFFNYFVLILIIITLYEWHNLSFKKKYYLPGIIFILFSFYTFYFLRIEKDYVFFLLVLIVCIATDMGGYCFGKLLKGPKISKISPNKTYAGMVGGLLLSLLSSYFYFNNLVFLSISNSNLDITIQIIFIVLLISIISQIGDFIISLFKRKSKIKNTGKIIPGHGGLLDRIDGMIFAFPFMFFLIKIL